MMARFSLALVLILHCSLAIAQSIGASWSPKSSTAVFGGIYYFAIDSTASRQSLYSKSIPGSAQILINSAHPIGDITISPSGSHLAFLEFRPQGNAVVICFTDGKQIASVADAYGFVWCGETAEQIALIRGTAVEGRYGFAASSISIVDVTGKEVKSLDIPAYELAYSPSDGLLYAKSYLADGPAIYRIANDHKYEQVNYQSSPHFSPTGQHYFLGGNAGESLRIHRSAENTNILDRLQSLKGMKGYSFHPVYWLNDQLLIIRYQNAGRLETDLVLDIVEDRLYFVGGLTATPSYGKNPQESNDLLVVSGEAKFSVVSAFELSLVSPEQLHPDLALLPLRKQSIVSEVE